jgi:cardiolipin synthase
MGILYGRFGTTLIIFLISGLTDLIDGLVARKMQQKTRLGAMLDPIADKLLLSTSFVLLTFTHHAATVTIPLWLTVLVFSRDIILVAGAVAIALTTGFTKFDPSIYGKVSTMVQIACVLSVLVANYLRWPQVYIEWLFYLTFAMTLISGIHYGYSFGRKFNVE